MSSKQSVWYRLGYALERTRQAPATGARKLATLKDRRPAARSEEPPRRRLDPSAWPTADQLVASGAVAVVAKVLDAWRPQRKAGFTGLVRAGLAGAGAAVALELVRPLLSGKRALPELNEESLKRVLVGAGQGLVYGLVVEPRLPGAPLLKGTVYGSAEYALDPMGGIGRLLGPHAPLRRVPVLGHLLEELDDHDRAYLEHVAFGVTLAMLYGSSPARSGIREDDAS
ncbi:MAG TPA: hypothetical protein VJ997_10895 [Longimicrobiales bacterium]|nr:hypothetical protein [Longimicrobiales bacterium]